MKSPQSDKSMGVFLDGLDEDGAIGGTGGAQAAENEGSPACADECDDKSRRMDDWDDQGVCVGDV